MANIDYETQLILKNLNAKNTKPKSSGINDAYDLVNNALEFSTNMWTKATKPFEGVIDFGAGLLAKGADLIGLDSASQHLQDFVKFDTSRWIQENANVSTTPIRLGLKLLGEYEKPELPEIAVKTSSVIGNIAGFAGALATGQALGGAAGIAPKVAQYGTVFSSSAGMGTEEALNEGANLDQALGYGAMSGAVETATEVVTGKVLGGLGVGVNKVGGLLSSGARNTTSNIATSGVKTIAKNTLKNFTEEGLEEVISDVVNPLLKKATYRQDSSYSELFQENGGYEGLLESFLIGGLSGGVYEIAGSGGQIIRLGNSGYALNENINNLNEINNRLKEARLNNNQQEIERLEKQKESVINQVNEKFGKMLLEAKSQKDLQLRANYVNEITRDSSSEAVREFANKLGVKNVEVLDNGRTSFDSATNTLRVSRSDFESNSLIPLHETIHTASSTNNKSNFVNSLVNTLSDSEYETTYNETKAKYKNDIMKDKQIQNYINENNLQNASFEEVENHMEENGSSLIQDYIEEEMAGNILSSGKIFTSMRQFMSEIDRLNSKGLKRLKNNIISLFKGKRINAKYQKMVNAINDKLNEYSNGDIDTERDIRYLSSDFEETVSENRKQLQDDYEDANYDILTSNVAYLFNKELGNGHTYKIMEDLLENLYEIESTLLENNLDSEFEYFQDAIEGIAIYKNGVDISQELTFDENNKVVEVFDNPYSNLRQSSTLEKLKGAKDFYQQQLDRIQNGYDNLGDTILENVGEEISVSFNDYVEKQISNLKKIIETKENQIRIKENPQANTTQSNSTNTTNQGNQGNQGANQGNQGANQQAVNTNSTPTQQVSNTQQAQNTKGFKSFTSKEMYDVLNDDKNFEKNFFPKIEKQRKKVDQANEDLKGVSTNEIIEATKEDIIPIDSESPLDAKKNYKQVTTDLIISNVNAQYGLEKAMLLSNEKARAIVQNHRNAKNAADYILQNGVIDFDNNGRPYKKVYGLTEIYKGLTEEEIVDFENYLFHLHNIDRMNYIDVEIENYKKEYKEIYTDLYELEEKIKEKIQRGEKTKKEKSDRKVLLEKLKTVSNKINNLKNKPIFSMEVVNEQTQEIKDVVITAEISKKIVKDYEKTNPEFIERSSMVNAYTTYLLDQSKQAGIISENEYKTMKKYYKNYVPTYRAGELYTKSQTGIDRKMNVRGYKNANGGTEPVMSIRDSLAILTKKTFKANAMNEIINNLDTSNAKEIDIYSIMDDNEVKEPNGLENVNPKDKIRKNSLFQVTFFKNGVKYSTEVSPQVAIGLRELQTEFSLDSYIIDGSEKVLNALMKTFKGLVTEYNPFFTVTNAMRDLQDALFYSKNGVKAITKNWVKAWKLMLNKSPEFIMYKQLGGLSGSMFEQIRPDKVENKTKKVLTLPFRKIQQVNQFVEQLPRFAEFIATLESEGKTIKTADATLLRQAVYNAQEVTLNFGVRGSSKSMQFLNRSVVPFMNAQIQGAFKILKTTKKAITSPWTSANKVKAISSLVVKASLIGIVPAILNGLLYRDDEDYEALSSYYKDNFYLIKIGGIFIRIPKGRIQALLSTWIQKSEDKNIKDKAYTSFQTLSPVSSLRSVLAPINDVRTNTTWYGGKIVSSKYDNVRPENQYDSSTSWFGKQIGKLLDVSPLKVDYLLDQYTGVIGDFILPMTSESGTKSIGFSLGSSVKNKFVVDSDFKSQYSNRFYNLIQETEYQISDNDPNTYYQAKAQLKYMNKIKTEINKIRDKVKEIENSNLSNKEKEEQTRILQVAMNEMYNQAINSSKELRKILDTKAMTEDSYEDDYILSIYQLLGAEKTFNFMDNSYKEKAVELNNVGIDYDTYFTYYMNTKGYDKEYKSEYINQMNLSKNQKYTLYLMSGYSIPKDYKPTLLTYIKSSNMSDTYKQKLINKLD